jgi:hypothetical protein
MDFRLCKGYDVTSRRNPPSLRFGVLMRRIKNRHQKFVRDSSNDGVLSREL